MHASNQSPEPPLSAPRLAGEAILLRFAWRCARKRLAAAPAEQVALLKAESLEKSRRDQKRSGRLAYPYAALFARRAAPGSLNCHCACVTPIDREHGKSCI